MLINEANAAKYALARDIISQHLTINSNVQLDDFEGPRDPAFIRHLELSGAYFLMAHDGSNSHHTSPNADTHDQARLKRARLRQAIVSCLGSGHAVALINGVEFRDTKVSDKHLSPHRRNKPH